MNVQHAIEVFDNYSPDEKIDFLIQFAHALTILARDTYEVGTEGLSNPPQLRIINELQHRITSFLIALRKNGVKRYPDDILVRIILEHPEDSALQRQLREAFTHITAQMIAIT